MDDESILLSVTKLSKYFPVRKGLLQRVSAQVKAVDSVNLFIRRGETLGLVGESGCGKTTAGRAILRLTEPTSGKIMFRSKHLSGNKPDGLVDVVNAGPKEVNILRRDMQVIFQDPYSSLDPRMTIASIVAEPLKVQRIAKGSERQDRVIALLKAVGLGSHHMRRYPHEFSGGQRQRIGIARSLALNPQLIIADEPVSALDVSVQAQVINLLQDLQKEFGLTYLFIAHDISVVKHISDRVAIMYLGKIVESSETMRLFGNPRHPYTEALISAVPINDPDIKQERIILKGDVPSPLNPPTGCYFHPRCRYAKKICKEVSPKFRDIGHEHFVRCHRAEKLSLRGL